MQDHENVQLACSAASEAFGSGLPPARRAAMLDAVARALDGRREAILAVASDETALTVDELTPEFARMTGTLRMFADLVREGSWVRAAIDTRSSQWTGAEAGEKHRPPLIGPDHDVRSMLVPLGPVAVFGSSNFPLAYGVCGGDTASAWAAGCPVVVKEHPAHPKTGRLLAEIACDAIKAIGVTAQFLGYIRNENPRDYSIAEELLRDSSIAAAGFTGSTLGGSALETLARERRRPIPVFAEMGSLNCVFVWPGAFRARGEQIADELAASVLTRVGQQCTKPGVVFVAGNNEHSALHRAICRRLQSATSRRMLARGVADNYYRRLDIVASSRGVLETTPLPTPEDRRDMLGVPVGIAANDMAMEDAPEMWEEIFGPAIIVARTFGSAWFNMPGALTATIYAEPEDIDGSFQHSDGGHWGDFEEWFASVLRRAGRVILNGVPTGVRVATGMVHGGPFPATNAPHTTAVGPRAIERWCRPVCYQNCPDVLLPAELRGGNPLGILRCVDGAPTRVALAAH